MPETVIATASEPPRPFLNIYLALAIAIPAGSTAVIFNKSSHLPAIWLAAGRLLIAALIIAPLAARDMRRRQTSWSRRELAISIVPALFLALSFSCWVLGCRLAPTVDAALIGNLLPVALPMVVFVMLRELPSIRETIASVVGLSGIVAMGMLATHHGGGSEARGDVFCAGSLVFLAVYLVLARQLRRGSLWIYLTPLYAWAGVFCAITAWIMEGPLPLPWGRELWLVLGLAIIPTVIGQSIYNRAMSEIRPPVLGVLNLLQCPMAGLAAWILWKERPTLGFWFATVGAAAAFGILMYPSLLILFRPPPRRPE
jgi:drug/metabolite transporter (DMT)-like permease